MAQHPDLPQPKFKVGDTVWRPKTIGSEAKFPCPDCNNTRVWKATSPAGEEHEISCPRCGRYRVQLDKLPSLNYHRYSGHTEKLTISGMEVRAGAYASADRDSISYVCAQTWGHGGGSTYYESMLFASEEEAQAEADRQAAAQNAKILARPEVMKAQKFGELRLTDAVITHAFDGVWNSWWSYRHLLEDVRGAADPDEKLKWSSVAELQAHLQWQTKFSAEYHPHILDKLIAAAVAGDAETVKAIGDEVAQMIGRARAEHAAAKPAEEAADGDV